MTPGILLINKPKGITSHDVVDSVRKITGERKVGHAGTLDPLATGVMVILVGREATKKSDQLRGQSKKYEISLRFGQSSPTLDIDSDKIESIPKNTPSLINLDKKTIEQYLEELTGTYEQEVPWFSAVKVGGKKLYKLARNENRKAANPEIKPPTKEITVHKLKLIEFKPGDENTYPSAKLLASVSSGTYTRAIVRDLGEKLRVPSIQTGLVRTVAGNFNIDQCRNLNAVSVNDIIPVGDIGV